MSLVDVARGAQVELLVKARKRQYFNDPVLWAHDYLGIKPWSIQGEIAMSVVHNKNTVVKAGHEVGKSWLAGLLIAWWVDTRWDLPGGCFVVSTAPSTRQINAVVWREVRRFATVAKERHQEYLRRKAAGQDLGEYAASDHPLPGYITSDAHWRLPNGIELGYGAKPADQADKEAGNDSMSGIHARYVLAVGDEAVGLSKGLIGDLANITSNATSRRFLVCNPTNPLSYVAQIYGQDMSNWSKHTISVFDSPNFHGPGICDPSRCKNYDEHQQGEPYEGFPAEVLETLVDQSYVDGIIEENGGPGVGEKSPTYISRVLGEFAWDMGFTLIRPEDIAIGLDTDIVPSLDSRPVLGVDFSRSKAGDKNTVYKYHDGQLRFVEDWNEPNAMATAQRVHEIAMREGVLEVRGDGQGLGGPILDRIAELAEGRYLVLPIDSSFTSPDITKWHNWRAYMYWSFQDRLSKGEIDLDLDDDKLQEQALGIEIKKRLTGRDNILLESKEEMRKRGVHSPDHADAAVMACVDMEWFTGNPLNGLPVGSVIADDRSAIPDGGLHEYMRRPGQPVFGWAW